MSTELVPVFCGYSIERDVIEKVWTTKEERAHPEYDDMSLFREVKIWAGRQTQAIPEVMPDLHIYRRDPKADGYDTGVFFFRTRVVALDPAKGYATDTLLEIPGDTAKRDALIKAFDFGEGCLNASDMKYEAKLWRTAPLYH